MEGLPREGETAPEPGWLAAGLDEELPGLKIRYTTVAAGSGPSPPAVKKKLREISDRFSGPQAIHLREKSIPWAYRVFFRHIGLDPDQTRTPVEELALRRMYDGEFRSHNRLDDALTIATMEVGVAVQAVDADRVEGRLGIRLSAADEPLGGRAGPVAEGTLIIADEEQPVALLFGETVEGMGVGRKTERTMLAAVGVKGVPEIALEEALWLAASAMRA